MIPPIPSLRNVKIVMHDKLEGASYRQRWHVLWDDKFIWSSVVLLYLVTRCGQEALVLTFMPVRSCPSFFERKPPEMVTENPPLHEAVQTAYTYDLFCTNPPPIALTSPERERSETTYPINIEKNPQTRPFCLCLRELWPSLLIGNQMRICMCKETLGWWHMLLRSQQDLIDSLGCSFSLVPQRCRSDDSSLPHLPPSALRVSDPSVSLWRIFGQSKHLPCKAAIDVFPRPAMFLAWDCVQLLTTSMIIEGWRNTRGVGGAAALLYTPYRRLIYHHPVQISTGLLRVACVICSPLGVAPSSCQNGDEQCWHVSREGRRSQWLSTSKAPFRRQQRKI